MFFQSPKTHNLFLLHHPEGQGRQDYEEIAAKIAASHFNSDQEEGQVPFTPFHMGPGILIKSLLRGSYSLMIFGWSQILIDLQPLLVLLSGEGNLHGFSHTLLGATLIALIAGASRRYLTPIGLRLLHLEEDITRYVPWNIAFLSAFIGTYSHIALDSIMHRDMQAFAPWSAWNPMLGVISVPSLHLLCIYTGLAGAVIYLGVTFYLSRKGT